MKMRNVLAAAAALVLTGAPAMAQSADEDVKCLLASNLFTKAEKDPAKNRVAVLSAYYYLGRVDARMPGSQLAAAMKKQAATITRQTAGPIMTACAKRLQSAGMAIQTLGGQLSTKK
ncbi:hypothetical protein ACFSCW_09220 [Sphingomonas tabacisoli]|uniref:Uncharacterized protein n=1 Tax=Sphingomonas tabacisoli TaxID=2249466 RepID=A0ABW4I2V3_9SPHN